MDPRKYTKSDVYDLLYLLGYLAGAITVLWMAWHLLGWWR